MWIIENLFTGDLLINKYQELGFQRLIFVTMLAWEEPYTKENSQFLQDNSSFQVSLSLCNINILTYSILKQYDVEFQYIDLWHVNTIHCNNK